MFFFSFQAVLRWSFHRNLIVKKSMQYMESATVKKWLVFFAGIVGAVLLADALSTILISATGLEGSVKLFAGFILYALLFFGILYAVQKIFHFEFFSFWKE
jgi:hypothetical protein